VIPWILVGVLLVVVFLQRLEVRSARDAATTAWGYTTWRDAELQKGRGVYLP
jgi:hypothetical protein